MGIGVHALLFLRYAKRQKSFGSTLTLGRQELYLKQSDIHSIMPEAGSLHSERYGELLFEKAFGATKVQSIDNSAYEEATLLHDMNLPVPPALIGQFDTIYDGGTLEHVFNVSQAFENCTKLVRVGGQILHVSPASNFCGHGFWQFSPELFFSLYSERNGFGQTSVFLARMRDHKKWYRVTKPQAGWRAQFTANEQVCIMVRTVKNSDLSGRALEVFQSDYDHVWKNAKGENSLKEKGHSTLLKRMSLIGKHALQHCGWKGRNGLNARNPWLEIVDPGNAG